MFFINLLFINLQIGGISLIIELKNTMEGILGGVILFFIFINAIIISTMFRYHVPYFGRKRPFGKKQIYIVEFFYRFLLVVIAFVKKDAEIIYFLIVVSVPLF